MAKLFNNAHERVPAIIISDRIYKNLYNQLIFTDDDFITTDRIYEIEERIVVIEDNEFRIEEGNCISLALKEHINTYVHLGMKDI